MEGNASIISIAAMILLLALGAGAQTRKRSVKTPIKNLYPIVIYPDYSYRLCPGQLGGEKCNEVPSAFIGEFAENKSCAGLTLKVLNSTDPEKQPIWWREMLYDERHHYWLVRVGLFPDDFGYRGEVTDLGYVGEVTGPDGVSHDVTSYLPNIAPQMREIVEKTCAIASGALRGGKVEQ